MKKIVLAALSPLALAVGLMTSAPACVSADDEAGEGEDEGDDEGPTAAQRAEYQEALLAFFQTCFLDPELANLEPTYFEGFANALTGSSLVSDTDAYGFNSEAFEECLALLRAGDCSADSSACNAAFPGTREAGEGCFDSSECVDGLACDSDGESCGTCIVLPGEGTACVNFDCAEGLVCGDDDVCIAPVGLNGDCSTVQCEADFVCNSDSRCVLPPGLNEPCPDFECADGLSCNEENICEEDVGDFVVGSPCEFDCNVFGTGLYCAEDNTCQRVTVVQPGEACDSGANYCVDQFSGNVCNDEDQDGTGICEVGPAAGEPCVASRCGRGASCNLDTDRCEALGAAGEACGVGCATGLTCSDDDVCVSVDDGEVCPA